MTMNSESTGAGAADARAREALITGKPPRIPPLRPDELGKDAADAINKIRKEIGSPPLKEIPDFIATMLRHPDLYAGHSALSLSLFRCELSIRDRELAILRTGWLCQAPFEWGEHVNIGKRLGSLTSKEVERVTQGSAAQGWTPHERAILRAVEELDADAMISDETWAALSQTLNEKQLMELPILVGLYQGVAYYQNSLRIRLMDGNKGLAAR